MQVIAESLSEEEIGGLKELFKMIDTDNSGTITFDELKDGLKRVGSELTENEIQALMEAVSACSVFTSSIIILCSDVLPFDTFVICFRLILTTAEPSTMVNSLQLRCT